jgi:hypothetical protein
MPDDLVADARKQAERSSPAVRAAALMRIARVQSIADPGQARITFEMALDEIRSVTSRDRGSFFGQAQEIAAAFAPDLLREIPSGSTFPKDFQSGRLVDIMLKSGHIDAAFDYVIQYDDPFSFPFGYAINMMHKVDDERQLTVLRRAMDAWRASRDGELMPKHAIPQIGGQSDLIRVLHLQLDFIRLFQWQWKILPPEEALTVVREIVHIAMEQPDLGTSAGYGEGIRITSSREHVLFEVLHILRHLDAPLAESLIANHEQLAAATRRYPNGRETIVQESGERRKQLVASGATCGGGGFVMAGNPRDFAYQMALRQSSQGGDFGPSIDHALERYSEDAAPDSPNQAPKTFWPSTCAFRTILYSAGKRLGPQAEILLNRIPDDDLRLFAQIELAAALAGLPELPETWREQRRPPPMQGTPMRAADGSPIRCPKCRWVPVQEARWSCNCGHVWNTFQTRGICPACQRQWEVTLCYGCHEASRHADWYPEG